MEASPTSDMSPPKWKELTQIVRMAKGRTASVRLCRRGSSGDVFAVKVMPRESAKTRAQAIFRERDILQSLNHPSIVRLFGTDKDEECLYFIMEAAVGGALHHHIRHSPGGCFDTPRALFYTAELVLALEYLGSKGVMHRDLKASNVVLDHHGHIKVVDFGAAKRLSTGEERSYTYCGTLHCMAPEMLSGRGHRGHVDFWALGVLLFEMLTGAPPFSYAQDSDRDSFLLRIQDTLADDKQLFDSPVLQRQPKLVPLLRGLLSMDSESRFDAAKVKECSCFSESIEWAKVAEGKCRVREFDRRLGEIDEAFPDGGFGNDVEPGATREAQSLQCFDW